MSKPRPTEIGIKPPRATTEAPWMMKNKTVMGIPIIVERKPINKLRVLMFFQNVDVSYWPVRISSFFSLYCQRKKKKSRVQPKAMPVIGTRLNSTSAAELLTEFCCSVWFSFSRVSISLTLWLGSITVRKIILRFVANLQVIKADLNWR